MSKKENKIAEEENSICDNNNMVDENTIAAENSNSEKTADLVSDAIKKAEEYKEIAQRLQAEFDNYRKRNNDSIKISRSDGINDVIIGILPVLDNFERGIATVKDETAKNGMDLIYKQLLNLLSKFEVEEILALNEEFNPLYHHAIAQIDDKNNVNKVVEVYQKGYKRKDKILRASMVKVAQ